MRLVAVRRVAQSPDSCGATNRSKRSGMNHDANPRGLRGYVGRGLAPLVASLAAGCSLGLDWNLDRLPWPDAAVGDGGEALVRCRGKRRGRARFAHDKRGRADGGPRCAVPAEHPVDTRAARPDACDGRRLARRLDDTRRERAALPRARCARRRGALDESAPTPTRPARGRPPRRVRSTRRTVEPHKGKLTARVARCAVLRGPSRVVAIGAWRLRASALRQFQPDTLALHP